MLLKTKIKYIVKYIIDTTSIGDGQDNKFYKGTCEKIKNCFECRDQTKLFAQGEGSETVTKEEHYQKFCPGTCRRLC